jgi:transposase InsO family protein
VQEAATRERIGLKLQKMKGRHRPRKRAHFADAAGRSLRTLRAWKKMPRGGRLGRPPHSLEKRRWSRLMVFAELATQGVTSSARLIDRALRPLGVPTILTREFVGEIKRSIRREARLQAKERRLHVEVLAADAITSLDGTHVVREPIASTAAAPAESPTKTSAACLYGDPAREPPAAQGEGRHPRGRRAGGAPCKGACRAARRRRGRAIQALMAVDVATMLKLPFKVVHAPTGKDVIDLLVAIRAERGVFPLVIATDNGSENVNHDVDPFLREHQIIHLRNLPRTPRHNPHVERSHREVKVEAELEIECLDLSIPLRDRVAISITRATARLNSERGRESRGWKTAAQLDIAMPRAYTVVARDVFYAAASAAMQAARDSPGSTRQQRLAERWALYAVMEAFGLIKLFRGGVPITALKPEGIT